MRHFWGDGSQFGVYMSYKVQLSPDGLVQAFIQGEEFLIPRGFAHGFLALSDTAVFYDKCDDFHHANDEDGLAWNDPAIGILWPQVTGEYKGSACAEGYMLADGTPLSLSEKDQKWPAIR